jgi:hypothetical protein
MAPGMYCDLDVCRKELLRTPPSSPSLLPAITGENPTTVFPPTPPSSPPDHNTAKISELRLGSEIVNHETAGVSFTSARPTISIPSGGSLAGDTPVRQYPEHPLGLPSAMAQDRAIRLGNRDTKPLTSRSSVLKQIRAQLGYLESEVSKLKQEECNMWNTIDLMAKDSSAFRAETRTLQADQKLLKGDIDSLKQYSISRGRNIRGSETDYIPIGTTNHSLQLDYKARRDDTHTLPSNCKPLRGTVESLTTDNKTLRRKVNDLQAENTVLRSTASSMDAEFKTLISFAHSLQKDYQNLEASVEEQRSVTEKMKKDCIGLRAAYEDLKRTSDAIDTENKRVAQIFEYALPFVDSYRLSVTLKRKRTAAEQEPEGVVGPAAKRQVLNPRPTGDMV